MQKFMQTNSQWLKILSASLGAAALVGCSSFTEAPFQKGQISQRPFGQTKEGNLVTLFTLRNNNGAEAGICNYGGLVIFLKVPDRNGHFDDVVLGYDNLADYIKDTPYFGAMIGRYGNRIAKGKFTLDGKEYTWPSITVPMPCTAALRASTRWSGNPKLWRAWRVRCWSFAIRARTARKATRAT